MGVPQAKVAPNRNVMLAKNDLILGAPLCSVIDWEQSGEVWPRNEYYDGSQSTAAGGCQSRMLHTADSPEGRSEWSTYLVAPHTRTMFYSVGL